MTANKDVQYLGTGRRKTSVARVFMTPGTGQIVINKKPVEEYLQLESHLRTVKSPLVLTETDGQFDIMVNVFGGGLTGQTEAIRHGIARALLEVSSDYRPALKAEGFLTRDSRKKERVKYGLKGARKAPQFSKR